MRRKREFALRISQENAGQSIQEISVELASLRIYELLMALDPEQVIAQLQDDPQNYVRIVTALTHLSEAGLKYERYRAEIAERKENLRKVIDSAYRDSGLSAEIRMRLEHELNLL
jgi:hypothetical protein